MTKQLIYDIYENLLVNKEQLLFDIDGDNAKDCIKDHIMNAFKLTIEDTLVVLESKEIKFMIDNYFTKDIKVLQ